MLLPFTHLLYRNMNLETSIYRSNLASNTCTSIRTRNETVKFVYLEQKSDQISSSWIS